VENISNKAREICIGLGLQEVLNYTLNSKDNLAEKMKVKCNLVEIENPVSSNWSVFRNSLIPGCLSFLSSNKHVEYPQKIFEIGDVVEIDDSQETKTRDIRKLVVLLTDGMISYENISSVLGSLMDNLGIVYKLEEMKSEKFVEGRCASVMVKNKVVGGIGEIHPEVIENFGLEMPVVVLEISLEGL
jgi:phenylalanyl-tRNA synthetase beta chain